MCRRIFLISLSIISINAVLNDVEKQRGDEIVWCTVSDAEHLKCSDFSDAVRISREFSYSLKCKRAAFKDQCMNFLDNGQVHLVELDPGDVYTAGRYHSVIPIMSERYGIDRERGYYSVAVIHSNATFTSLKDLKDKRICFSSVGDMAGWVVPMSTLITDGILEVKDCNNLVKSASLFFGPSCAPNSLIDKHNPTGDNPQKMCELCAGKPGERCSGSDPYSGFQGAFQCLESKGDVAFLKHTTVEEMTQGYTSSMKYNFRLLCPYGGTVSVDQYQKCNWGYVPSHVIATTSDTLPKVRKSYQEFLKKVVELFGQPFFNNTWSTTTTYRSYDSNYQDNPWNNYNQSYSSTTYNPYWYFNATTSTTPFPYWQRATPGRDSLNKNLTISQFNVFRSGGRYGNFTNLIFQDATTELVPLLGNQQTFTGYLDQYVSYFLKIRKCPVQPAILCVVSEKEMEKCNRMRTAFRSQMLKPDLNCIKGQSQLSCMHMIKEGVADLVVLEAGDIYTAGQKFGLIPIIAEQYNLNEPYFYVVAVAKQSDKETDLLYLKGKRSCHTGINQAAGWVVPLSFLVQSERMRSYGCNSAYAASEFFSKSCAPGALSQEYAVQDYNYKNLCDLCHGTTSNFCARDSSEPFYGHTGAFQCLVEGGGEIAFVKHTTVFENTAGRNRMWWARNVMPEDFEILCRDGSRMTQDKYMECNLGKVASNAIVTSASKPQIVIDAYIDLFVYAQQFYGSKYSEDFTFKMFVSEFTYSDLIFQDACQQLKPVPEGKRNYRDYLGQDFVQAMKMVDCTAGSCNLHLSLFCIMVSLFLCIAQNVR